MIDELCARVTDLNNQLKSAQASNQILIKHLIKYGLVEGNETKLTLAEKPEWLEKEKEDEKERKTD